MAATATVEKSQPTDTGRCGEYAGFERHRRRGELACGPCKNADTAYRQANQAARKSRPLPPMPLPPTFGRYAALDVPHDFAGDDLSQCVACFGWRNDPRHPLTGGPVVGR
ncbi:hypothetical protein AB0C02_27980 [Micromonospora sp. NPDC048999]|uniref:hypothetical protein n=1 Tax=Micromonospora sp. NPDC048999 TaxID=3155391 RepID=UPI0033F8BF3F